MFVLLYTIVLTPGSPTLTAKYLPLGLPELSTGLTHVPKGATILLVTLYCKSLILKLASVQVPT